MLLVLRLFFLVIAAGDNTLAPVMILDHQTARKRNSAVMIDCTNFVVLRNECVMFKIIIRPTGLHSLVMSIKCYLIIANYYKL